MQSVLLWKYALLWGVKMVDDITLIGEKTLISLAEVRDRYDPAHNGAFLAKIYALGDSEETVQYVSPYATGCEGGFVAVPEVGMSVLVCSPMGTMEWFYLGTTFLASPEQAEGEIVPDSQVKPLQRADPYNFNARGEPMHYFFKGKTGAGIEISEEFNPKFFNKKVELKSSEGKIVSLIDSPGIDSIVLDSGNSARVTLTNMGKPGAFWQGLKKGFVLPPSAFIVDTRGTQLYLNRNSRTDILVKDGVDLNILNNSGGNNKWAEPEEEHYGNVNIQSKQRDVNILTRSQGGTTNGRIFIECLNTEGKGQVIEIETHGTNGDCVIRIKSTGRLELQSGEDLEIDCKGAIHMKAANNINIEAGGDLTLLSGGTIFADGGPNIRLNEGGAPTVVPGIGDSVSHYGEDGVVAY